MKGRCGEAGFSLERSLGAGAVGGAWEMDKLIHKQIDRQIDGSRKSRRVRMITGQIGKVKEKGEIGSDYLINECNNNFLSAANTIITKRKH